MKNESQYWKLIAGEQLESLIGNTGEILVLRIATMLERRFGKNLAAKVNLMRLNEGAIVAGAAGRQLERLDGEGEVLVVGVVHQEPVVK